MNAMFTIVLISTLTGAPVSHTYDVSVSNQRSCERYYRKAILAVQEYIKDKPVAIKEISPLVCSWGA